VVPEVVAELFAFATTAVPSSGAVPCAPLLVALEDPLFPLLGGGAADAAPSTLMESLQEYTRLGRGVLLTEKNPD